MVAFRSQLLASALVISALGMAPVCLLHAQEEYPASSAHSPMDTTTDQLKTQLDNSAITAQIKTKLLADGRTHGFDINVDTDGEGNVVLAGTAPSVSSRRAAGEVARNVDGVRSVSNQLTVADDRLSNPQTLSAKAQLVTKEGWLTAKVKAAMVQDDQVPATEVSVTTEGTTVILSGTVNSEVGKRAAIERARQVEGVTEVDASQLMVVNQ